MDEMRVCKKCLIREMAGQEKIYETIKRMIEDLEPEDRAGEELVEKRLVVCKECDQLLEGTCKACGCYVELRTATKTQECPYEKW